MGDSSRLSARDVALLAGAALVAGAVGYFLATGAAVSEEPPIRVKGGSIYFELGGDAEWKQNGNAKNWEVDGDPRDTEDYLVYFAPNDPTKCTKFSATNIKTVTFVHRPTTGNDTQVEFKAPGNKTKVKSDVDLVLETPRRLALKVDGFVRAVKVDNDTVCTFENAAQLDSVLLTEEP